MVKRFLPLLMLTGLLFGQDVLHLKSGESYTGTFYGIVGEDTFYGKVGEDIVFKVEGETSAKKFPIREVTSIETSDGMLSYPFNIPKIANDIPITNERHETLNYSVTNFDILILKRGTAYFGEYSKIEGEIVYFKPQNAHSFQPISIKQIQTLKLKDGHFIIGEQLPVAIEDEFSVWLKSQEAIEENQKLSGWDKVKIGCLIAVAIIVYKINKDGFDLGLDIDLSGHETAW